MRRKPIAIVVDCDTNEVLIDGTVVADVALPHTAAEALLELLKRAPLRRGTITLAKVCEEELQPLSLKR